jgi:hypothetical protein
MPVPHLDSMLKGILLVVILALAGQLCAQQTDYAELIRSSSQHEQDALENQRQFEFLERTEWQWGSETRTVIETNEGRIDRIIAFNDQPLAEDQVKKQEQRISKLLRDTSALRQEVSEQHKEEERRGLLVTTLPDAFLFEFSGVESDGKLRFAFEPDPKFSPKNRETQIFKGMRGRMWIDPRHRRITRVQGELFKDVNFGWGILGRLSKGGRFEIIQSQVGPGAWRITTLDLEFKGKEFLFSSFRVLRKENSNRFKPTPPKMTAREALMHLLTHYNSGMEAQ